MQDGESWASAFLVVVGIEKNDNDLLHYRVSFRQKPENPVSVFRVFDLLFIQLKPYENEFSTALSECKAVARCATRKTDTAINRVKTVGAYKTVDTTCKTNTSIIEKTVGDCKIPIIFNLQHNNDENVTSIITHNRVEINLRYIRNP